jgi:hypothetical protein
MKNVIIGSAFVLLTASAFTGCVTSSSDDSTGDDGGGGSFITTADWKFESISDDGGTLTEGGCPGGQFDTAAVISVSEDQHGQTDTSSCTGHSTSTSTCVVDLFTCSDGSGTDTLPGGYWAQFVSITSHDGSEVYADSIGQLDDITANDQLHAEIIDNGGYILASWHLVNGGTPTTCADVAGQNGVEMDATLTGPNTLIGDAFDCDKGEFGFDYTDPLPAGTYTLSVGVIDANNAQIGAPAEVPNVTVGAQNDIQDVGDLEIDVGG